MRARGASVDDSAASTAEPLSPIPDSRSVPNSSNDLSIKFQRTLNSKKKALCDLTPFYIRPCTRGGSNSSSINEPAEPKVPSKVQAEGSKEPEKRRKVGHVVHWGNQKHVPALVHTVLPTLRSAGSSVIPNSSDTPPLQPRTPDNLVRSARIRAWLEARGWAERAGRAGFRASCVSASVRVRHVDPSCA